MNYSQDLKKKVLKTDASPRPLNHITRQNIGHREVPNVSILQDGNNLKMTSNDLLVN